MLKLTRPSEGDSSEAVAAQRRLADALPILVMISDGDGTVKWEARSGVPDPIAVLDAMEHALHAEDDELMATALFGVIDLEQRTLRYANAGHPPPLVRTKNRDVRELPPSGTPLGWKFDSPRTASTLPLDSVDLIVLYTDGVVEGAKDGLDGLRRLSEAIANLDAPANPHPATTILKAAQPTPRDDAAILVIRIAPESGDASA